MFSLAYLRKIAAIGGLALAMLLGSLGCHETDPVPGIPGLTVNDEGTIALIEDSFERAEIFADPNVQQLFGWRGFINDWGEPVLGLEGNQVQAVIFDGTEMGPASDGENALYFSGRPGRSLHSLYLLSQTYDLAHFNSSVFQFDYLTMQLNDAGEEAEPEYLRVEVCTGTVNECGVNEDALFPPGLNNPDVWATVWEHDPAVDDEGFNGRNHTQQDWRHVTLFIDLNDVRDVDGNAVNVNKSAVVFRFVARMHDGFTDQCVSGYSPQWGGSHDDGGGCTTQQVLEDGAALDNVLVDASTLRLEDRF